MPELRLENSIVDDRYLVDRCLGRGSYAEIFLAYDQAQAGQPLIIKALNVTLQGSIDAELELTLIENFQNEAIALDKVRHPGIIRRLGHGTAADLEGVPFHYLLLEYMPGGDLLSLCRNRPVGFEDALFYFQQVAEALSYAHTHHVIHRDIKPNNLLLSGDRRVVKIADFGVAKLNQDDCAEITRVGTDVFAPPEHHPDATAGEQNEKLTPSADVYSMAKSFYTAITGRAPRQFSRLPISELPAELADMPWASSLTSVLRKATETRVADRYQSVQEFWGQLVAVKVDGSEAATETDPEATIVRARLGVGGAVGQPAARPNFQALASAPLEIQRSQKARIVVELPQRIESPTRSRASRPEVAVETPTVSRIEDGSRPQIKPPAAVSQKPKTEVLRSKGRRNRLAAFITSEWLRRVFVLFLAAALVGVVASTYYYFAERRGNLPGIFEAFGGRDGVIANADNVNLRSEPRGVVLVALPAGTRVRALEDRSGWIRVKVTAWAGAPPDNAPETGWVDGHFVRFD